MNRGAVLVAGGAGYIGSHVCKALARDGYLPVTVDDLSSGHAESVKWGPLIRTDIADSDRVGRAIEEHGVVGALHFAAKSLVGESVREPLKYFRENVSKGVAFLETLQAGGVQNFLFSSTAAVYGTPSESRPIREEDATQPINPYGASKLAFEEALRSAARASGDRCAILRYFNAAGADSDGELGEDHEPETHLIPLIIRAARGETPPLTVFGDDYATRDGTPMRDYVHVEDLAQAHLLVLERLFRGDRDLVLNAGAGTGSTVREVLRTAEDCLDQPVPATVGPRRAGDPPMLVADTTRLTALGWRPTKTLGDMINSAAVWRAKTAVAF
ncbi:MAG TPA: UDP-glucose 4-epimerase GalE [Brevundimonas sp.]